MLPFNTCAMDMDNIGAEYVISNHWHSSWIMQHFSSGLTKYWYSQLSKTHNSKMLRSQDMRKTFTSDTLSDWQNPHIVMLDDGWSVITDGAKSDDFEVFLISWSSVLLSLKSAALCNRFFCLLETFWWFSIASEVKMSHFLFAAWRLSGN